MSTSSVGFSGRSLLGRVAVVVFVLVLLVLLAVVLVPLAVVVVVVMLLRRGARMLLGGPARRAAIPVHETLVGEPVLLDDEAGRQNVRVRRAATTDDV